MFWLHKYPVSGNHLLTEQLVLLGIALCFTGGYGCVHFSLWYNSGDECPLRQMMKDPLAGKWQTCEHVSNVVQKTGFESWDFPLMVFFVVMPPRISSCMWVFDNDEQHHRPSPSHVSEGFLSRLHVPCATYRLILKVRLSARSLTRWLGYPCRTKYINLPQRNKREDRWRFRESPQKLLHLNPLYIGSVTKYSTCCPGFYVGRSDTSGRVFPSRACDCRDPWPQKW